MLNYYRNTLPQETQNVLLAIEREQKQVDFAFQNVAFFNFLSTQHGVEPVYFILRNNKNEIKACVLAVIISSYALGRFGRRCIVWNQPIVLDQSEDVLTELLTLLKEVLAKEVLFIEFRNFGLNELNNKVFPRVGFAFRDHYGLRRWISDLDEVWQGLSESKRRQIRTARKNGATTQVAVDRSEIDAFYVILNELYQKKVKKPLPSLAFFQEFFRSGPGIVLLVKEKSKVIGGIVLILEKGKGAYEWYVAGSDHENKELYPSVMATWSAIEYASKNGYSFFDFMGGGKPGLSYGVRDFKLSFGASMENSGRWMYSNYKGLLGLVNRFSSFKI